MRLAPLVLVLAVVVACSDESDPTPDVTTTSVATASARPTDVSVVENTTTSTTIPGDDVPVPPSDLIPHDENLCPQDPDEVAASEPPHGPPCD